MVFKQLLEIAQNMLDDWGEMTLTELTDKLYENYGGYATHQECEAAAYEAIHSDF